MKIINKTIYNTDVLEKIINRVAEKELSEEKRKILEIELKMRPGRTFTNCTGWAYIGGRKVVVSLPMYKLSLIHFAHTVGHEFGHVMGYRHRQMRANPAWSWISGWQEHYNWAHEYDDEPLLVQEKLKAREKAAQVLQEQKKTKDWQFQNMEGGKVQIWIKARFHDSVMDSLREFRPRGDKHENQYSPEERLFVQVEEAHSRGDGYVTIRVEEDLLTPLHEKLRADFQHYGARDHQEETAMRSFLRKLHLKVWTRGQK